MTKDDDDQIYNLEFITNDTCDNTVDKGSNQPAIELNPLNSRNLYSPYSHQNNLPCYGDYCRNGCWKHFCKRCGRGSNRFLGTCCSDNKIFDYKLNKMILKKN